MSLPGITRSAVADALLGAVVGWLGAPSRDAALMYAVAGGAAAGVAGGVGLGVFLIYEVHQSHIQGGLRRDLHGG
jgi:hypothetical protein